MACHIQSRIEFLVNAHKGINGRLNLTEMAFKSTEILDDLLAFSSLMSDCKEFHHSHRVGKAGKVLFLLGGHSRHLLTLNFT